MENVERGEMSVLTEGSYPEVRGGALIALFFLPAGRISYGAKPGDPQPHCV